MSAVNKLWQKTHYKDTFGPGAHYYSWTLRKDLLPQKNFVMKNLRRHRQRILNKQNAQVYDQMMNLIEHAKFANVLTDDNVKQFINMQRPSSSTPRSKRSRSPSSPPPSKKRLRSPPRSPAFRSPLLKEHLRKKIHNHIPDFITILKHRAKSHGPTQTLVKAYLASGILTNQEKTALKNIYYNDSTRHSDLFEVFPEEARRSAFGISGVA
jgi:hypothetical protein